MNLFSKSPTFFPVKFSAYTVSRIVPRNARANEKNLVWRLSASKQISSQRNFNRRRTCVSNFKALKLTQPKMCTVVPGVSDHDASHDVVLVSY